jgi:hypothetical protein
VATAFPSLDPLPWLSVAQLKQVRVAPPHLGFELPGYLVAGKLAKLLGDDELKGQVKQQVANFSADRIGLSFAQCVVQLQYFLDQIRAKRFPGLCSIPGAPAPQLANHRHRASKR